MTCLAALGTCSLRAQDGSRMDAGDGEWVLGLFSYTRGGVRQSLTHFSGIRIGGQIVHAGYKYRHSQLVGVDEMFFADEYFLGDRVEIPVSFQQISESVFSIPNTDFEGLPESLFSTFHLPPHLSDTSGRRLGSDLENVIIVVHGYNPGDAPDMYTGAFADLTDNLELATTGTPWSVVQYHWEKDSATGAPLFKEGPGGLYTAPIEAASVGDSHGRHLAFLLLSQHTRLKRVMFMCHSAGSWIGYRATKYLNQLNPRVDVELILMDPFIPGATSGGKGITPLTVERMSTLDEVGGDRVHLHNYYGEDGFDTLASCLREAGFGNSVTYGTEEEFDWTGAQHVQFRVDNVYALGFGDPCDYGGHQGPIKFISDSVRRYMGFLPEKWNVRWDGSYGFQNSLFSKWRREESGGGFTPLPSLNIANYTFDELYPNGLPMMSVNNGLIEALRSMNGMGGSLEDPTLPVNTAPPEPFSASVIFDCTGEKGLYGEVVFPEVAGAAEYVLYRDGTRQDSATKLEPLFGGVVEPNKSSYTYRVEAYSSSDVLLAVHESEVGVPSGLCEGLDAFTPTGFRAVERNGTQVWLYYDPVLDAPNGLQYAFVHKRPDGTTDTIYAGVRSGMFQDLSILASQIGVHEYTAYATYSYDRSLRSPSTQTVTVETWNPNDVGSRFAETQVYSNETGPHCLSAGGAGYATCSLPLVLPDVVTIEGRIKLRDRGHSQTVFANSDGSTGLIIETGADNSLVCNYADGTYKYEYRITPFLHEGTTDVWHSFAFVVDTGNRRIFAYLNGEAQDGYSSPPREASLGAPDVGVFVSGRPVSFEKTDGDVDYIRVWGGELSPEQIAANHNVAYADRVEGMIANWNFDGDLSDSCATYPLTGYGALECLQIAPENVPLTLSGATLREAVAFVGLLSEDSVPTVMVDYALLRGGVLRLSGTENIDLGPTYTWQVRFRPHQANGAKVLRNSTKIEGEKFGLVIEQGGGDDLVIQQLSGTTKTEARIPAYISPYNSGEWVTATMVVDNVRGRITTYAEGVLVGTQETNGTYTPSPLPFIIGGVVESGRAGEFERFEGEIDYMRIFNSALAADEIAQNRNTTIYDSVGMIGNWNFDGDGSDSSGNGYHAEVVDGDHGSVVYLTGE